MRWACLVVVVVLVVASFVVVAYLDHNKELSRFIRWLTHEETHEN
jgi:hypothetical protein